MKQLHDYSDLLATTGVEWGLIGPREADRMWERHIDNCLAVTEDSECLPQGASVMDVGSGAGLPGLVWAIARPDLSVTLVEPLERRTKFLELATTQLGLGNVRIQRARAQQVDLTADRVTARAVSKTANLVEWAGPLVAPGGLMVLLKGRRAEEELAQARLKRWSSQVRDVGIPPRTRVIVLKRKGDG